MHFWFVSLKFLSHVPVHKHMTSDSGLQALLEKSDMIHTADFDPADTEKTGTVLLGQDLK